MIKFNYYQNFHLLLIFQMLFVNNILMGYVKEVGIVIIFILNKLVEISKDHYLGKCTKNTQNIEIEVIRNLGHDLINMKKNKKKNTLVDREAKKITTKKMKKN